MDVHLHASGHETTHQVLKTLDAAGVDVACILAPFLTEPYSLQDGNSLQSANEYLASLVRGHEDRLVGFGVVNPALPGAAEQVERCLGDLHLRGLKMVPAGWFPYDEVACAVYARAERYRAPILFHSGIFIDGRSSRFCRPAYFEALRDFPGLRVALAHLGWPWSDEAVAVCLIDRVRGMVPDECQFRLDISFGPPPCYREEVVGRACRVLGADLLLFGSDRFLPCSGDRLRSAVDQAQSVLDALGITDAERRKILSQNALSWLGLQPREDER